MTIDLREHIRWMLTLPSGDVNPKMQDLSLDESDSAIIAAFTTASVEALGDAPTLEAIRQLISEIRGTYVKSDNLQPALAEATLRAAFGERELLEGVSYLDTMKMQLSITYGIVQHLKLAGPDYEAFLDEATELAKELVADER
jgi:hypothetical protein